MFGWEFPPHHSGGLGVACYGLTRSLSRLGFHISFVMPKRLDVGAPWVHMIFADMPEITVRAIASPVLPYSYPRFARRDEAYGYDLLAEVLNYASVASEIAKLQPCDVIYAHDWLSFGAGIEAKRVTGKPLIVHVHATEFDRCGGPWGVNREIVNAGYGIGLPEVYALWVIVILSLFIPCWWFAGVKQRNKSAWLSYL